MLNRQNPERMAWIVLLISFMLFCSLVIGIPTGVHWYLLNATEALNSVITSAQGTVLVTEPDVEIPAPITYGNDRSIPEGSYISTDETSQASVSFFDESNITLYNSSVVQLEEIRRYSFDMSPNPDKIYAHVLSGRIRATVTEFKTPREFIVRTPHGEVHLEAGSYSVEVAEDETQVTNRYGIASVLAQGEEVILQANQRTFITTGQPPSQVERSEQNLIKNGNFSEPFTTAWSIETFTPSNEAMATVNSLVYTGRNVVEFRSFGVDRIHTEATIRQDINLNIADYQSLRVGVDMRLIEQSLEGGGSLGSEFPLMIHLAYNDANGNARDWYRGFYYEPPPNNFILYNEAHNSSQITSQYIWYPYESDNLLESLGDAKPVHIRYIRLYASGWIYHTMIADVKLLAQQ